MAPSEFYVRLQHGITGGFAPPTPSAVHELSLADGQSSLQVLSQIRAPGTPELSSAAPKSISASSGDVPALVDELESILRDLPTEQPPGSEDIYRLDTSIMYGSKTLEWCNGGPQGCGGGTSFVEATDEQREQFKRAVDIVNKLVGEAQ